MSNKKEKPPSRSDGLEELRGHKFTMGVAGQEQVYITTRRKIAEYAGRTYRQEFYRLLEDGEEPDFELPEKPKDGDRDLAYQCQVKAVVAEQTEFNKEKGKVFLIVLGQCMSAVCNHVERLPDYRKLEKTKDVVGLLERIKEIVFHTDNNQFEYWTIQAHVCKLV